MSPQTRARIRRARRIVVRILLLIVLVLVVAAGVAIAALHTDWGREKVRVQVEKLLDDSFAGDVTIGRLEGSIFGAIVLRDVVIRDAQGGEAIRADALELDLALLPLIDSEARFYRVVVDGLVVEARPLPDGRMNLAALTEEKEEASAWDLVFDRIVVRDARIAVAGTDRVDHLDGLDVTAAIRLPVRGRAHFKGAVAGFWRESGLPFELAAEAFTGEEVTEVSFLDAALGRLAVTARGVRIAGDEVSGDATILAPAAAIRALVPDSPLRGDLELTLSARPAGVAGTTSVAIEGSLAGAELGGVLVGAIRPRRVAGTLRVTGADAAAIVEGGIATDLDLAVTVGLAGERGVATLSGQGTGEGGLRADVDAVVTLADGVVHLGSGRVRGQAADLAAAVGDVAPVEGRLDVDLRGHGRLVGPGGPRLAVRGEVDGTRLRSDGHRIAKLHVEIAATGLPGDPAGRARLEARRVVIDGRPAGDLFVDARSRPDGQIAVTAKSVPPSKPWMLDLDALVRVRGERVTIRLGEHRLRTHGVGWHGRGGQIEIDGEKIQVARLRTTIARGHLVVNGTYRHGGRRPGDFASSIHLDHVDLAEVDRSLGLRQSLEGRVDAQVHVIKRGRRWTGSVEGDATQVVVRDGAAPIDLRANLELDPDRVRASASVKGRALGTAMVDLDVTPPRRFEDPEAWMHLERKAIRVGRVRFEELDLAGAAATAGVETDLAGRLDGDLTLTGTESRGVLRLREVTAAALPAPLDVDLEIDQVEAEIIDARLIATVRELGTARIATSVGVPARPFDLHAWAGLDAEAIRGITVRVDDFVLDARRSARLGLAEPWHGRADLLVEVAPGLRDVKLDLSVAGLRGGPLVRPVDLALTARSDDQGGSADLSGQVDGRAVLTGHAELPITIAALRKDGLAALSGAPLDAELELARVPVGTLMAVVGRDSKMVGTIDGTATVTGTVAAPTARAAVLIEGFGLREPQLRRMAVDATWEAGVVTAKARGVQADGGRLDVDARAELANLAAATAVLDAHGFDIAPLAQLGPQRFSGIAGILDAEVRIRGFDPARAAVTGSVALARAQLPLGGQLGTLHDGEVEASLRRGKLVVRGEGKIGNGTAKLRIDAGLDGLVPRDAEIGVNVERVTLLNEQQPRITGTVKATLGRGRDGRWTIDAETRAARVVIPDSDAEPLHPTGLPEDMVIVENGKPPPVALEPEDSLFDRLGQRPSAPWLVARIRIPPVGVETPDFRGKVAGELTFTVGDDGVAIDGELEATTGSVALFDRRYRVSRATVSFDGSLDPALDIQLVHDFPDLTLYVEVSGRLSEPELALSSQPATYTEGQLFGFLLGGTPGMEPSSGVRDAATGIASSIASKLIGGYVEDYLPVEIDVLRFEAATASSSAAFTIGKWLSRRLFVAYRYRVYARTDQNSGEAEIEYWLRPDILLEGIAGDRGHHDADLLWIQRW